MEPDHAAPLTRSGYGEAMRLILIPALLLATLACVTTDEETWALGYNDGCEDVEPTAYEFGMENGAACHPGPPGVICSPADDGAYGAGWMAGCDECFQSAYDAGWAAGAPEGCPP